MRKFLTALIVIPLGLILVDFAVANRHFVTVSFDPFISADPSLSVTLPLFLLLIVVAVLGVLAGGCAVWLGQGRWRRAARRNEAEARSARAELADLRAQAAAARQDRGKDPQRLPIPSGAGLYGPIGRDKQRATL
ncbi:MULTISPECIES: LapA family protein [unclassified Bradyrhizobium]|uniref:LapA family protein n=1 Tax=unclassified Bradyrhizobium TaxID=2631580 RepID=UPI002479512C|nr:MULTISPECIES: LapA family protein [unclassified Bradyrhizobium]WGR71466.1 LapA family protein [Bradyrhizobium sp. ISRA426]WGR76301.1 LapA family protein [Bradyrhizobium sp. ISRA430]WGR86706.1 LapA family protein [Bradyrhizobium sp. ISRA432]